MILLKQVTVIDTTSPFHQKKVDVFINNGVIQAIDETLVAPENTKVWAFEGSRVSIGWCDIGTYAGDPGFEHKEDLVSVTEAAKTGGFTAIACQPNTLPVIQSKSEVLYIKNRTLGNLVDVLPIGAISHNCEGKDLTEMFDMHTCGAVAFSDGKKSVQNNGLMLRALLYSKPFDGLIINHPHDKAIASSGVVHEGKMSTSLGMKGIPSLAEELMIHRDLHLVEYAEAKLHFANISTKGSVELIRQAKAEGLKVSASVNPMNLVFNEEELADFDSNYKVLPPLRTEEDRTALLKGLLDGTIDSICTNHTPQEEESKKLEFAYADFGVIMLETAYAALKTFLPELSDEVLVEKLAVRPRQLLNLKMPAIKVGMPANLTIFHPEQAWTYQSIKSKSDNSPFIGQTFKGQVLGVINNNVSWRI